VCAEESKAASSWGREACVSTPGLRGYFFRAVFFRVTRDKLSERDSKADVLSVIPSSERIEELWVVCGLYTEIWSCAIGFSRYHVRKASVIFGEAGQRQI